MGLKTQLWLLKSTHKKKKNKKFKYNFYFYTEIANRLGHFSL